MRKYKTEELRNITLVGHSGSGKTSLAESMLFTSKAIDRLGRVDEGTTVMDHDPEEIRRKVSVSTALAAFEWKNSKINMLDTPGFFDFAGEVKSALRVAETAVIIVDATGGVQVGTEKVWGYAEEQGLSRIIVVNKLDRENTSFAKVYDSLKQHFGARVAAVQLPVGTQESFKGVVDLVAMKMYAYEGGKVTEGPVPEDMQGEAEEYRAALVEAAAEGDDDLLAKFFDDQPLTAEEVTLGLRKGLAAGRIIPVLCASAGKQIGVASFLDFIASYAPSPAEKGDVAGKNKLDEAISRKPSESQPFSSLVFKTMADPFVGKLTLFRVYSGTIKSDSATYNANKDKVERIGQLFLVRGKNQDPVPEVVAGDIGAVAKLQETSTGNTLCDKDNPIVLEGIDFPKPKLSLAVEPKSKGDEEKIGSGLARLTEEDPTFAVNKDATTHELIVSGLGDQQLEVITSRLSKKFGVEVTLKTPKVAYKETIRAHVKVEGKHKKQSGGRGQFGHCWIEMDPNPDAEFEFVDKIFGGSVPRQYIPAVEKGVRETMEEGVIAGYPVTGVRVTLTDGSYHPVDSSEMAFKIAASMAFKKGFAEAKPALLEPVVNVEVTVPDEYMGDVIGDMNKKRGRILGMEPRGGQQVVKAQVPKAEMFQYAIDLRSMTQGRGDFTMEFSHYEEVPSNVQEKVVAESSKNRAKEE